MKDAFIDDEGEPGYAYMEKYFNNMMLRKDEQYLAFLSGKKKHEWVES